MFVVGHDGWDLRKELDNDVVVVALLEINSVFIEVDGDR